METYSIIYLPTGCHYCRVEYDIAGGNPHAQCEPALMVWRAVDQSGLDVWPQVRKRYPYQRETILGACRAHLRTICERALGQVRQCTREAVAA